MKLKRVQLTKLYSVIGAGYLIIVGSIVLSIMTEDNQYWAIGIPSAVTLLTADTLGKSLGKNNKINTHETT